MRIQKILKRTVFFYVCIKAEQTKSLKGSRKPALHYQLQKYILQLKRVHKIMNGDCKFEGPYLYLLNVVMQNKFWACAHLFTKFADILINLLIVRGGFDIHYKIESRYGHQISLMLHQFWQLVCTFVECTFQLQFLDTVFKESTDNCFSKTSQYLVHAKNEDFMRLMKAPYQAWDLYSQTVDKYSNMLALPILITTALQNNAHGMPELKASWIEKNVKEGQYTKEYTKALQDLKESQEEGNKKALGTFEIMEDFVAMKKAETPRDRLNEVLKAFDRLLDKENQTEINIEAVRAYKYAEEQLKTMTVDEEEGRKYLQKAQIQLWDQMYNQSPAYMTGVCTYLAMTNLGVPIACIIASALMQFTASSYLMDYLQHEGVAEHYLIDTTENLGRIYLEDTKEPEKCRMLEIEKALLTNHIQRQMIKSISQMNLFHIAGGLFCCVEKLKELSRKKEFGRKGIDRLRRAYVAWQLNQLAFLDYQVRKMIQQHHTNTAEHYTVLESCLKTMREGNQPEKKQLNKLRSFSERLEIRIEGEGFAYETKDGGKIAIE